MGGGGVPVQKCTQYHFAKGLCFLPPIDNHSDCTEEYFKKDWCMMEVHHRSIFQLRDKFQAQHSGLMLIAVIALTILLEHIVEMIEKRVEGRHAMTPLVGKVGKELMLLGIISFTIFLGVQLGNLNESDYFVPLEFAHIVLFGMALTYVVLAAFFLNTVKNASRKVDAACALTKAQLQKLLEKGWPGGTDEGLTWWQSLRWQLSSLYFSVSVQIARSKFIQEHRLEADFDFGLYHRYALSHAVDSTLDVTRTSWAVLLVLIVCSFGFAALLELTAETGPIAFAALGWCITAASTIILVVSNIARTRNTQLCISHWDDTTGYYSDENEERAGRPNPHPQDVVIAPHKLTKYAIKLHDSGKATSSEQMQSNQSSVQISTMDEKSMTAKRERQVSRTLSAPVEEDASFQEGHGLDDEVKVTREMQHAKLRWDLHSPKDRRTFPVRKRRVKSALEALFLTDCAYKALFMFYFIDYTIHVNNDMLGFAMLVLALVATSLNTFVIMPRNVETFYFVDSTIRIRAPVLRRTLEDTYKIVALRNKFLRALRKLMIDQLPNSEEGRGQTEWIRLFFKKWAAKEGGNPDCIQRSQLAKMCNGKKFNELNMGVSDDSLELLMRWLDPDRNNEIDYAEFMGFICPSQGHCAMPMPLRHNALRSATQTFGRKPSHHKHSSNPLYEQGSNPLPVGNEAVIATAGFSKDVSVL